MSAEVVPIRPAEVEETAPLSAVDIPPSLIVAIARAAVEAYKDGLRQNRNAEARAYYRANRERILAAQALRREAKRAHAL